ncbi:MAG TPA: glycoside hydrolase family 38 C-terminal domain-containing protein [Chloroflexia bacterium]|nr:glycoside hydrolase family 38 C-terminal domain-containing protein [Chloroflexia bacterium]
MPAAESTSAAPAAPASDSPTAPLTLHVVSHTHWDREWYLPFQLFRIKLVRLVDKLLAILAADPAYTYFTLDGQTVVLEDYLEVRPERAAELRAHVASGRLLVGPWYILPDEFLVSGESLIRNFLRGHQIAASFGATMEVGYIPDPFGHISQMPQILRGFGIDWAVFWRGIGTDVPGTEFFWQAPDGSTVLATRLLSGYANGLPFSFSLAAARRQVGWLREVQAPLRTTEALLVLNGDDHIAPSEELPAILATLNAELAEQDVTLVHSTLPEYWAAITAQLQPDTLPTHRGEFREAATANLLPGVLSTRMWIKQANYAAETLLERWVEPWEALHWATDQAQGSPDPGRALQIESAAPLRQTAWKYLLQNQPHDSVCGCSVDQVHDEMKTRYANVEQIGGALRDEALQGLSRFVNTETVAPGGQQAVVVFNPHGGPCTDLVQVTVEVTASLHHFRLLDDTGAEVPYEIMERRTRQVATFDLDPLAVETVLAMATDGRVMDMAVLDVYMHRATEAGVIDVDITIAENGEPNLLAVQTVADAARRLVAAGQVQIFRLRGQHAAQVVARFLARAIPSLGYRTYTLAPAPGIAVPADDSGIAVDAAPAGPAASEPAPRPAAVYQPDPPPAPELPEARPGLGALHPALMTATSTSSREYVIENEWLRVQVDSSSGLLSVSDKQAGVVVRHGNVFVDSGDAGDEYNYCPPPQDAVIEGFDRPPRIDLRRDRLGSLIVVEGELALPAWLSEDRQSRSLALAQCAVRSVIRLLDGVRRVDIQTTIDNRAGDHRLRVLFEVPVAAPYSDAEGTFDVVRRPAGPLPGSESWLERAVATYPQKAFVAVGDGKRGLLLANRGLPEFEVQPSGAGTVVALTLLRSVGWLSRDDMAVRPGHAGPGVPTPGGQTFGVHTFEYALVPFVENWLAARAYQLAHQFAVPLHALADSIHDGPLPAAGSLLHCDPPELVLSALKRSEDGTRLIVRAWNIAAHPIDARVTLPALVRDARLVRLDESPIAADDPAEPQLIWAAGPPPAVALTVAPREIVTLSLGL